MSPESISSFSGLELCTDVRPAAALRSLIAHSALEVLECSADEPIDPSPYPPRA